MSTHQEAGETATPTWRAGWYPDPDKEAPYRYYNGERWTDRRRDRMPVSGKLVVSVLACVAIAVGSVGPWITLGIFHAGGLDNGRDGILTIIVAGLAALVVFAYYKRPSRAAGVGWLLLGGAAAAVTIYDLNDIASRHANFLGQDISPDPGWGIILALIGGLVLGITGLAAVLSREP